MPKCIVSGCPNHTARKDKNISNGIMLHGFPKDLLRIKCWLSQINQNFGDIESFARKILEGKKTNSFRICSEHFSPDSYRQTKRKIVLKDDAIPRHFHKRPPSSRERSDRGNTISKAQPIKVEARAPPRAFRKDVSACSDNTMGARNKAKAIYGVQHREGSPQAQKFSSEPPPPLKMTSMDNRNILKTDRMLRLTLEILFLLTGEDYTVVKNRINSSSSVTAESGGRSAAKETNPMATADFVSHEKNKKILQLTNQIIHLLTGEVPARCEDVAVYFSIEEWDYVDKHKHLYKNIVMDDQQQNLYKNVNMDDQQLSSQAEQPVVIPCDLTKKEPMFADRVDHEDLISTAQEPLSSSECGEERVSSPEHEIEIELEDDLIEEPLNDVSTSTVNSPPGGDYVSSDLSNPEPMSADSMDHSDTAQMPLSCSECGKCFKFRSRLVAHKRVHTGEKLFSCPECGKCFMWKSLLMQHKKIHTGEHQCLVCGRCFTNEWKLIDHQRTHTGERPFTCHQCGKSFGLKTWLTKHKRLHTEENAPC